MTKDNEYEYSSSDVDMFFSQYTDKVDRAIDFNYNEEPLATLLAFFVYLTHDNEYFIEDLFEDIANADSVSIKIDNYLNQRFEILETREIVKATEDMVDGRDYEYVIYDNETKAEFVVVYDQNSWDSNDVCVYYGKSVMKIKKGDVVNV